MSLANLAIDHHENAFHFSIIKCGTYAKFYIIINFKIKSKSESKSFNITLFSASFNDNENGIRFCVCVCAYLFEFVRIWVLFYLFILSRLFFCIQIRLNLVFLSHFIVCFMIMYDKYSTDSKHREIKRERKRKLNLNSNQCTTYFCHAYPLTIKTEQKAVQINRKKHQNNRRHSMLSMLNQFT